MIPITCLTCKNYVGDLKCTAFPEGIPDIILRGENDHSKPLPEQENDIVYQEIGSSTKIPQEFHKNIL